jgi:uncharacterized protein (DUF1684 family)
MDPTEATDLLDWKRRIFDLYRRVREATDPADAWQDWRRTRDEMFRRHPQSPLPTARRAGFPGASYFAYDPAARVAADVEAVAPERYEIATSRDGTYSFTRVGRAVFDLSSHQTSLELYWLDGYGGGLFLPFRDATAGRDTYGAGRYLIDTIKGADLGMEAGRLLLDFNFAYNPSCAYDPRWACPLAPPPNRIDIPVHAGERKPPMR